MKPRDEKALRLVAEERVHVGWISAETLNGAALAAHGTVDGFHDTYLVAFSPFGRICTCPAGVNHRACSHGIALELAVMAEAEIQLELLI